MYIQDGYTRNFGHIWRQGTLDPSPITYLLGHTEVSRSSMSSELLLGRSSITVLSGETHTEKRLMLSSIGLGAGSTTTNKRSKNYCQRALDRFYRVLLLFLLGRIGTGVSAGRRCIAESD